MIPLQRQSKREHTHCVQTLGGLHKDDASALISTAIILGRRVRGLFDQPLQPNLLPPKQSRVYIVGSEIYMHAHKYTLSQFPKDQFDTLLFDSLPPLGEIKKVHHWTLQIVHIDFEGMLKISERVIPLPTHLSVGAEQPLSFSKEYIYQSLI